MRRGTLSLDVTFLGCEADVFVYVLTKLVSPFSSPTLVLNRKGWFLAILIDKPL